MQTKLSYISNIIFKYFILFAIASLWLNFYIDNLVIVGLISIIISLTIGLLIFAINKKKKNTLNTTNKEQKMMADISLQLLLADENKILNFFENLLSKKRTIVINKNAIKWDDSAFIPIYDSTTLNGDIIAKTFKNNRYTKHIFIAGISFSEDARKLAEKIKESKITLLDETATFNLMKKYSIYPDFKVELNKKEKFRYSQLKNIAFTKNNAKHYLISGFIILLTSFFIRYNVYYLIFATLLFIFASISYFKPVKKLPDTIDEL